MISWAASDQRAINAVMSCSLISVDVIDVLHHPLTRPTSGVFRAGERRPHVDVDERLADPVHVGLGPHAVAHSSPATPMATGPRAARRTVAATVRRSRPSPARRPSFL